MPVICFFFGNWAHKIVASRLGRLRADVQSMCLVCWVDIQANKKLIRGGGLDDVNG